MKKLILSLAITIAAFSCTSYKQCYKKFGHIKGDSIVVVVHDTIRVEIPVVVPPDNATLSIMLDSICGLNAVKGDTIFALSEDSLIEIKEFISGKSLKTDIKYKGRTLTAKKLIPVTEKVNCPPCIEFKEPEDKRSFLKKQFDKFSEWICIALLILCLFLALFKR